MLVPLGTHPPDPAELQAAEAHMHVPWSLEHRDAASAQRHPWRFWVCDFPGATPRGSPLEKQLSACTRVQLVWTHARLSGVMVSCWAGDTDATANQV